MSSASSDPNRTKSDTNPVMPLAGLGKGQAAPTDLQDTHTTFDGNNATNGDNRPGASDHKESSQAQVTPHLGLLENADKNLYHPDPVQESKAAAPLGTEEEITNPRAELPVTDQDNPTFTSASGTIGPGLIREQMRFLRHLEELKARSSDDAPQKLSRSSTADSKEELSKYKSIGDSALRLCFDLRSILDKQPENAMEPNKERLMRSIEEIESNVGDVRSSGKSSESKKAAQSVDILYRVRLFEQGKSDKFWYQDVPFSGIDLERIEPAETEHISIFDVIIDVDGKIESDDVPPDEKRKTWKGRKNIEFGKHISITRQKTPAMVIKAPKLLFALKSRITYYPTQAGDMSFIGHPYKMLLQHYPMLAAFRATYRGPNQKIAGHLMVTKDKLQLHEPSSVLKSDISSAVAGDETRLLDEVSQDQTNTGNDLRVMSDGHLTGEQLSPEQQIQEILDLETSLEVDTGKPWKDHNFGEEKCDQDTAYQIGVLLAYLGPTYHKEIVPELNNHKLGKASFKKLWVLFQPGVDVYALVNGQYAGFVVLSCEILEADKKARKREDQVQRVAVAVWNLAYAGQKLYRDARRFVIPSFEGTRDITSLEIFPTRFSKDKDAKWDELVKRGDKYYEIIRQNPAYRVYDGHTLERGSKRVGTSPRTDSRLF